MVNVILTAFFVSVATWFGSYLSSELVKYVKRRGKRRKKTTLRRHGKKGGKHKKEVNVNCSHALTSKSICNY
ncbi:hypothetical protein MKY34_00465 [Sporosarcina sp. FSL K6-1522]|uniref:hypothetical protein n=1 Tax=Sporosarcina sp. FSL K6-1522 TaxID=2921554 RepID=UPI003159C682